MNPSFSVTGDLDPDHYDFIGLLTGYYEKLKDKSILSILWDQLTKKEPLDSQETKLCEYRIHLPIDLHKYLQVLEKKFSETPKENLQVLDGSYKKYLLTFLFFCTKKTGTVTDKSKLIASTLYLKITILPEVGKLFLNKFMYITQMLTAADLVQSSDISEEQKILLVKLVKKHCVQEDQLDEEMLAGSTNFIALAMILGGHPSIVWSGSASGLASCCMKALRMIILHTSNQALLRTIAQRLFRCTKKKYSELLPSSNQKLAADVIAIFLKGTFKISGFERKFDAFIAGFIDNCTSQHFTNYKDAVKIMNAFPEMYYKELLTKMVTLTSPSGEKTALLNVFNIIREIFRAPPNFPCSKIAVLYSCAVNNVVHHFVHTNVEVASLAIDIFSEINDSTTSPIHKFIFSEVQIHRKLVNKKVESILTILIHASDMTFSTRNKKLLQIFARFVAVTPNLNPIIVQNALNGIMKNANPQTFESSLDALQMCFLAASHRNDVKVAEVLLQVVHRFAFSVHDKSSTKYLKHLFTGMLSRSCVDDMSYPPKYYYRIYLEPAFDYEAFFIKCKDQISEEVVAVAIDILDYTEPCSGILLCCLLEHYPYTRINVVVPYVIENFNGLSGHITAGYICAAVEKILKNKPVSVLYHPQLQAIEDAIMKGMFERNFPVRSIKPIFSLYETIRNILNKPQDDEMLTELISYTSKKVLHKLLERNIMDTNSTLYLNEICLILNKTPNDDFLERVQHCLDNLGNIAGIMLTMQDTYTQMLTLLCTIAIIDKSKVSIPLKYLQENLKSDNSVLQIVTIKLLYSICKEITHEFETIIQFAFKHMTIGTPSLIKMCVSILEELVHDDYIKLNAEDYFRLVYPLACSELKYFVRDILVKRFILSNQNDITKNYIQCIMYINKYFKLPNYPVTPAFEEELKQIKFRVDSSTEMLEFLFRRLPINKRFNILMEINTIFEDVLKGRCKFDDNFFKVLLHLITTIKLMKTRVTDVTRSRHYYWDMIKHIEKQIIRFDPTYKEQQYYKEFENEIIRLTLTMFKLLFSENGQLNAKIQIPLFDAFMHWFDFVRAELVYYVHFDKGKVYDPYFTKLVQFFKKHRRVIENFPR